MFEIVYIEKYYPLFKKSISQAGVVPLVYCLARPYDIM